MKFTKKTRIILATSSLITLAAVMTPIMTSCSNKVAENNLNTNNIKYKVVSKKATGYFKENIGSYLKTVSPQVLLKEINTIYPELNINTNDYSILSVNFETNFQVQQNNLATGTLEIKIRKQNSQEGTLLKITGVNSLPSLIHNAKPPNANKYTFTQNQIFGDLDTQTLEEIKSLTISNWTNLLSNYKDPKNPTVIPLPPGYSLKEAPSNKTNQLNFIATGISATGAEYKIDITINLNSSFKFTINADQLITPTNPEKKVIFEKMYELINNPGLLVDKLNQLPEISKTPIVSSVLETGVNKLKNFKMQSTQNSIILSFGDETNKYVVNINDLWHNANITFEFKKKLFGGVKDLTEVELNELKTVSTLKTNEEKLTLINKYLTLETPIASIIKLITLDVQYTLPPPPPVNPPVGPQNPAPGPVVFAKNSKIKATLTLTITFNDGTNYLPSTIIINQNGGTQNV